MDKSQFENLDPQLNYASNINDQYKDEANEDVTVLRPRNLTIAIVKN